MLCILLVAPSHWAGGFSPVVMCAQPHLLHHPLRRSTAVACKGPAALHLEKDPPGRQLAALVPAVAAEGVSCCQYGCHEAAVASCGRHGCRVAAAAAGWLLLLDPCWPQAIAWPTPPAAAGISMAFQCSR